MATRLRQQCVEVQIAKLYGAPVWTETRYQSRLNLHAFINPSHFLNVLLSGVTSVEQALYINSTTSSNK